MLAITGLLTGQINGVLQYGLLLIFVPGILSSVLAIALLFRPRWIKVILILQLIAIVGSVSGCVLFLTSSYSPFSFLLGLGISGIGLINLNLFRAAQNKEYPQTRSGRPSGYSHTGRYKLSALSSIRQMLLFIVISLVLRNLLWARHEPIMALVWAPLLLLTVTVCWIVGLIYRERVVELVSVFCLACSIFFSTLITISLHFCLRGNLESCLIPLLQPYVFTVFVAVSWVLVVYCFLIARDVVLCRQVTKALEKNKDQ